MRRSYLTRDQRKGSELVDHGPTEERLRAIYGDRIGRQYVELLTGRAAEGNWLQLMTDVGAERTLDVERWTRVSEMKLAAERQLQFRRARRTAEVDTFAKRATDHRGVADLVAFVHAAEAQEVLLLEQIDELAGLLEQLQSDRGTWLIVPDDREVPPPPDLAALAAQIQEGAGAAEPEPAGAPVRPAWHTVAEFADCIGVNRTTVSRWCSGLGLPSDPRRRPWDPGAVPVDESLGLRYRRVLVEYIPDSFWRGPVMRARRDELLRAYPQTKGWQIGGAPGPRCFAPVVLPTWLRDKPPRADEENARAADDERVQS